MWVKPKPDTVVRDPRTKQHMPSAGVAMPEHDLAFARLLNDGDLVECDAPAEPATAVAPHAEEGDAR